jgi:hypothetical protein
MIEAIEEQLGNGSTLRRIRFVVTSEQRANTFQEQLGGRAES